MPLFLFARTGFEVILYCGLFSNTCFHGEFILIPIQRLLVSLNVVSPSPVFLPGVFTGKLSYSL